MSDAGKRKERLMSKGAGLEASETELEQTEETVSSQTAELARASQALEEKDRLILAFHQIGQTILSSLDLDQILDDLAQQIVHVGIFRSLMVALVHEDTHSVRMVRSLWGT